MATCQIIVFMVLCIYQGNLNKMKMGILNIPMLSTRHNKFGLHLILLDWVLFFYIDYYFTKVKSKAISKKIIKIRDKIKKSFLFILSASFLLKGGKHSTVRVFLNWNYTILIKL